MKPFPRFKAKVCLSVTYGIRAYNPKRQMLLSKSPIINNPSELPDDFRGRELEFFIEGKRNGETYAIYQQ